MMSQPPQSRPDADNDDGKKVFRSCEKLFDEAKILKMLDRVDAIIFLQKSS